jgi:hypothetical protein
MEVSPNLGVNGIVGECADGRLGHDNILNRGGDTRRRVKMATIQRVPTNGGARL